MRKIILSTVVGLSLATGAFANGTQKVKEFELTHAKKLHEQAKVLKELADDYYNDLKAYNFDYAKSWQVNKEDLAKDVQAMQRAWIEASSNYEIIEGIVAGMPQTVKYDLILDAGIPASEGDEDVAPHDLECGGKCKFTTKKPGNFFHNLLEPTLWGTHANYVGKKVDLNGDGVISKGEVLPHAKWLKCVATNFERHTSNLVKDINGLDMTLTDVFTAELTMIPTMGDYFEDWKNGKILGKSEAFIALSRIFDIKGISGGLKVAYMEAISPELAKKNSKLDQKIKLGFFELTSFVDNIYMDEEAGKKFKPEDADAYAAKAQDMADRLSALIAKGAKILHITPDI